MLRHVPSPRWGLGVWLLGGVPLLAGCGSVGVAQAPTPHRVPPGAVAVVGAAPITAASFEHWLAILSKEQPGTSATTTRSHNQAVQRTVSFLVKAQWLLQEASAESINKSVLNKLVSQQTAHPQQPSQHGLTRSDIALQARLNIITEALQSRHSKVSVSTAQVAHYYAARRAQFNNPAVHETLMVITHSRTSALAARAALAAGEHWATVAKHWSEDSSAAGGGGYAIVEGIQPAKLVRAAIAAKQGAIVGPIPAPAVAGPPTPRYYLFKVTGSHPASSQPLAKVAPQIKQTLTEQQRQQALDTFVAAYERRWRARTLCAPGYVVTECGKHPTA